MLSFALNTGAYTTEIFAGSIRETSHGEVDAARAFGMSRITLYRRIVIPSALRRALPVYSNEVILMLHATTLAFTATVPDILKVANDAYSATYDPFDSFRPGGHRVSVRVLHADFLLPAGRAAFPGVFEPVGTAARGLVFPPRRVRMRAQIQQCAAWDDAGEQCRHE